MMSFPPTAPPAASPHETHSASDTPATLLHGVVLIATADDFAPAAFGNKKSRSLPRTAEKWKKKKDREKFTKRPSSVLRSEEDWPRRRFHGDKASKPLTLAKRNRNIF